MFSKENKPGLGTALILSLPLFAGCGPSPGEGLSLAPQGEQSSTLVTSDQLLREHLLVRLSHPKSVGHAELAGKAFDAYNSTVTRYGDDPNALYNSATELRDFILENRNTSLFSEDAVLFDDATILLIKSGPAIDITYRHQSLGDRNMVNNDSATSNSNVAHLAEFKMACATVIYDCTLP